MGTILSKLLALIVLLVILSIIILVHELGHFLWARHFKVHIYEFSMGMGPLIKKIKGKKDKIDYNIRAFPIGGYVSMAGEVYEDDNKIPKKKLMCNKPWHQRLIILVAGVVNNFILALVLLFVYSLIWGAPNETSKVSEVIKNYPAAQAGLKAGDTILQIDGKNAKSWDTAQILLLYNSKKDYKIFKVKHEDGQIENFKISPVKEKDENSKTERLVYGIKIESNIEKGFIASIKYSFTKFGSIVSSMIATLGGLFTGKIALSALSGPVGIYEVVGSGLNNGLAYMIYLVAFLSINVGFINILPFPAFDGGRVFFMIIEKIKGSAVDSKFENTCHTIGFILLLILMVIITINDIIRLF